MTSIKWCFGEGAFKVAFPITVPLAMRNLSKEQFGAEIRREIDNCKVGRGKPADQALREIDEALAP